MSFNCIKCGNNIILDENEKCSECGYSYQESPINCFLFDIDMSVAERLHKKENNLEILDSSSADLLDDGKKADFTEKKVQAKPNSSSGIQMSSSGLREEIVEITERRKVVQSHGFLIGIYLVIAFIGLGSIWYFFIHPMWHEKIISEKQTNTEGVMSSQEQPILHAESPIVDVNSCFVYTTLVRENGMVDIFGNTGLKNGIEDWSDIVAIYSNYDILIGLKSDGTLKVNTSKEELKKELIKWTNIRSIYYYREDVYGITNDNRVVTTDSTSKYDEDFTAWDNVKELDFASIGHTCFVYVLKMDGTVGVSAKERENLSLEKDLDKVSEWTDIVSIASCQSTVAGVKTDGTVLLQGGTLINSDGTVLLQGGTLINSDGTVLLQGDTLINSDGTTFRSLPSRYSELIDVKKVVAGYGHLSFLKNDGTVISFGNNQYGQCETKTWKNVVDIAASGNVTIAKMSDGTLDYAGQNYAQVAEIKGSVNHSNLAVDLDSIEIDPYMGKYTSSDWKLNLVGLSGSRIAEERYISSDAVALPFFEKLNPRDMMTGHEYLFVLEREIMTNPLIADMVAQGIAPLTFSDGKTIADVNPWIMEFLNKTTEAMNISDDVHPHGWEIWLDYENDVLYVNGEYRKYAIGLCLILEEMDYEVLSYSGTNWMRPLVVDISRVRTVQADYEYTSDALVFSHDSGISFGISLNDKSLIVPK